VAGSDFPTSGLLRDQSATFGDLGDGDDEPMEEDGRRIRRQKNRASVVDALLDLYRDGNLRPSSTEIAERAGLSSRSLFRYFDDVDDLMRDAVRRQQQRALPLLAIDAEADAPLAGRVAALVEQRFRLFEAVAPAATVSRLHAPFQATIATELAQGRAFLRAQLIEMFGTELAALGPTRSSLTLAALDIVTSFESFQLLRFDQALAPRRAKAAMAGAIEALLAEGEVGPAAARFESGEPGNAKGTDAGTAEVEGIGEVP
jgi:AcrR family transcriptional regulator